MGIFLQVIVLVSTVILSMRRLQKMNVAQDLDQSDMSILKSSLEKLRGESCDKT